MDITKIIIELHQLFEPQTFLLHITNSIRENEEFKDFNDPKSVLDKNVYSIVKIGETERFIKGLVWDFEKYLSIKISNIYWSNLYIAIIERILSPSEPQRKEEIISDIYLCLENLRLDAFEIYEHEKTRFSDFEEFTYEDEMAKGSSEFIRNPKCGNPFQVVYYQFIYTHLNQIIDQFKLRFGCYINEKTKAAIKEQEGKQRFIWAFNLDEDQKQKTEEGTRLIWGGNISDLTELAAALISTDSVKLQNAENEDNDGKIGAYLFMLFDIQKNMTPDQYYRYINDIKKRNDKVVFIDQLAIALKKYLEEGRKDVLKRRRKSRKSDN